MKFLICFLLSLGLFAQVCHAEEMMDSSVSPFTTVPDITLVNGFPANAKLKSVLYSSTGEICVGINDESGLSLYTWPFLTDKESPVLTSVLSMNDATCHDLEEYDGDRVALLCTELQNDVIWSSIYLVSNEAAEKVLSQTNQIFSLCCYNSNIIYSYLDEQNNAHVACIDSVGALEWDLCLDSQIVFSHLISTEEGVFCAGYNYSASEALYRAVVTKMSHNGQLLWIHQTNQHVYLSDAAVLQDGCLVIIGDLNEYDYEGYYIACFNEEGMVWQRSNPVPYSSTLTTCISADSDQISFAHRKLRERKAATLVTVDYQGNVIHESKVSFEGVDFPTIRLFVSKNEWHLLVVSGMNENAEDTIQIIYGKGLWTEPEP